MSDQYRRRRRDGGAIEEPREGNDDRPESIEEARPRAARKRRSWRWWVPRLVIGGTFLAMLVWLAPAIVAHTSLRQTIVSSALADFRGKVTVGAASLGWLSPVSASDIAAFDAEGSPLARLKAVRSEKTLWGLLSNRNRPGTFHLEEPAVHIALRPDGSNWEDALAVYLTQPAQGEPVGDLRLEIIGGMLEVHDQATAQRWSVADLNATLQLPAEGSAPLTARAAGSLSAAGKPSGGFQADVSCSQGTADQGWAASGQAAWQTESLALSPLGSLLSRFLGDVELQGLVTSRGTCQWSGSGAEARIQLERLAGSNVALRAPAWLGTDTLRSTQVEASGAIASAGAGWRMDNLQLVTDFARLQGQGTLPLTQLTSGRAWSEILGDVQREEAQLSGEIDLARTAAMLRSTLRLRAGTEITSGTASILVASRTAGQAGFQARVQAANLAAVEDGREFRWDQPIAANAQFHYTPQGPVIEELVCRSDFLNIAGRGTLAEGSATLAGDLTRLAAEVGRFVDWGDLRLAGRLDGELTWQTPAAAPTAATGRLTLKDFEVSLPGSRPWRERELSGDLAASARVRDGRLATVHSASVTVRSDRDQLRAELQRPVEMSAADPNWPLRVTAAGELATWLPRLQPLGTLDGWNLSGTLDLDATAAVDSQQIDAQAVKLELTRFRAEGPERSPQIDEPLVRIESRAKWDFAQQRLVAESATLASSAVAFRAEKIVLQLPGGAPAVSGTLGYRADLSRASRWWADPQQPASSQLSGLLTGVVRAAHEASVTQVDWSGDVKDLVYAARVDVPPAAGVQPAAATREIRELWREAALKVAGRQRYDHRQDRLQVDQLDVESAACQVSAGGTIEQLLGQPVADLRGTVGYDLATLTRLLQPTFGAHVQLSGRETGEFQLRGPLQTAAVSPARASGTSTLGVAIAPAVPPVPTALVSQDLAGGCRAGWASANLGGFLLGPGRVQGTLSQQLLRFEPLDVPVSDGRLRAAPSLDLSAAPVSLLLDKGRVAENVRISPQMCQTWLKFVAPTLADATRAEGTFSVDLDGTRVPLADLEKCRTRGTLTIHAAQVGPGPLAQEFVGLAQQIKTLVRGQPGGAITSGVWMQVPEQQVTFDVQDGRVNHQGLTVTVGDLAIRTTGSVGFDQTLAIVAEVPVRDEWVQGKPYLAALQGTALKLPVGGVLSQPRVDQQALANLNRQLVRDAAGRVLEDQIGRGLQQLLGPRPRSGGTP